MGCCGEHTRQTASGNGYHHGAGGLPVRCCVALLKGYKRYLSPLFPPSCRFTPTCSEYAIEALQSRGVISGLFLTAFRLLRCHPFSKGGYDPVMPKR